ncbi:putative Peptidase M22, glycoprotease [Candidatus Glomeribacter gigasporarum BEG34]|uniref:N(6)-L-threonylcarbamoyladenine synthase n=1 Tax=Candidatus Glomeribacter gigasporarum BEG34 TaxID=1070319 RepID=G2J8T9_9BURK|nr:tRNA (adenosine(37)-N6)-threonylcarbamoyltransferase complex dimerization subunit type 1 TsaB [Candidatus Glomeribacter gigasporarum]CCD29186.1 putative Peptidase M22, glycoprotease [Candidatus Glomeribacter gigasporarum BEG34]
MSNTLLLALDTSTEYCSVALAVFPSRAFFSGLPGVTSPFRVFGLANLFIRHENTDIVSSERLLPMVREVFDEARRDLSDCAAIAFGAGPGAFTGIRTAAGAAQGLAFALQIPMIPVNTLLACAQAAHMHRSAATRVLAALDARMDEVYWGVFEWEEARANWRTVQAATVSAPEQAGAAGVFTLAGNAAAVFGARLAARASAASIDPRALPHAAPIARLGWQRLCAGYAVPAMDAQPEYVRNRVAFKTVERIAKL